MGNPTNSITTFTIVADFPSLVDYIYKLGYSGKTIYYKLIIIIRPVV